MSKKRPTEGKARDAIQAFLLEELEDEDVPFELVEDGEDSWAFWVMPDDTTSYLHSDLKVEWYGTNWGDDE